MDLDNLAFNLNPFIRLSMDLYPIVSLSFTAI